MVTEFAAWPIKEQPEVIVVRTRVPLDREELARLSQGRENERRYTDDEVKEIMARFTATSLSY